VIEHGARGASHALTKIGHLVVTVRRDCVERRCEAGVGARPLEHDGGRAMHDLGRLTNGVSQRERAYDLLLVGVIDLFPRASRGEAGIELLHISILTIFHAPPLVYGVETTPRPAGACGTPKGMVMPASFDHALYCLVPVGVPSVVFQARRRKQ